MSFRRLSVAFKATAFRRYVVYFHIQPDGNSILGSGHYSLSNEELKVIREAIAQSPGDLRGIIESETFKRYFGELQGEQLKSAPKGYPKDHPALDLLRYKSFAAFHPLTDEQVMSDDLLAHALEVYRAIKPFTAYLTEVIERAGIVPSQH